MYFALASARFFLNSRFSAICRSTRRASARQLKGVRSGVERRRGWALKSRDPGRRDAPGDKILKERRASRRRRRTGTSVRKSRLKIFGPLPDRIEPVVVARPPVAQILVRLRALRDVRVLLVQRDQLPSDLLVVDRDLDRRLQSRVQVRIVIVRANRRVRALGEQILVQLHVPVVLREVRRAVQRRETPWVPLVHRLRAVPKHVVQHVDLLVRRAEGRGSVRSDIFGAESKGVRSGVERRRGVSGLKPWCARRETTAGR
eukprot:31146-Pelagococcus_subviridis.AAC.7